MSITLKKLIDTIFEEEDSGNGFATGLYKSCFKNNELITTKTCNDFVNNRISIFNNYTEKFNYDNFEDFYNEVVNWFRLNRPNLLRRSKATSFLTTIRNISLNYYNKINQVN